MTLLIPARRPLQAPPFNRNELWRRARAVPTLDLRFAENKSLVDAISGQNLVTFTRASSGTYVDSAGVLQTAATNEPRFDHDPVTGASLGLLIEEQRTNLLLRSEEFNVLWATQGTAPVVASNTFTAPNGTTTADRVTFAAADSRIVQGGMPITSGITYTITVYARSAGTSLNRFRFAFFDQSVQNNSGDFVASSTQWQRFSYSFTSTTTNSFGFAQIRNASDNLANDLYFWGAQLEAGVFPTSYIPTTAAAATRNADVVSITGANFLRWYRQDEGTVFCDAKEYPFASPASRSFYGLENSSQLNTDWIRQWIWNGNTSALLHSVYTSLGGPVAADLSTPLVNEQKRSALAYRLNDFARSNNGAAAATDLAGNLPVGIDRLTIGYGAGGQFLNGHIRRLTYWPQRLSNATLQAITQ